MSIKLVALWTFAEQSLFIQIGGADGSRHSTWAIQRSNLTFLAPAPTFHTIRERFIWRDSDVQQTSRFSPSPLVSPSVDLFHTWSQSPQGMPWASRFALLLSVHCRSISTNASRIHFHWIAGSDMYKRARQRVSPTGEGRYPLFLARDLIFCLKSLLHFYKSCLETF